MIDQKRRHVFCSTTFKVLSGSWLCTVYSFYSNVSAADFLQYGMIASECSMKRGWCNSLHRNILSCNSSWKRTPQNKKTWKWLTLRIMGSQDWWFGDPRTLLCTSKPFYRRVQWFLGHPKMQLKPWVPFGYKTRVTPLVATNISNNLQLLQGRPVPFINAVSRGPL